MAWVALSIFLTNGVIFVTSTNSKIDPNANIDRMWGLPHDAKQSADGLFRDLMLPTSPYMGPLLMFASSQKPPQHQTRLPGGPDFLLKEEMLLRPSASVSLKQFNPNGFGKPRTIDRPQQQTRDYSSNNFRPSPLTYGFTPKNKQDVRKTKTDEPRQSTQNTMNHQRPMDRNIHYQSMSTVNQRQQQILRQTRKETNLPRVRLNDQSLMQPFHYSSDNIEGNNNHRVLNMNPFPTDRLHKNHNFPSHSGATTPLLDDTRQRSRGEEKQGRKFVLFHAPSFTPTERPSSAPYSNNREKSGRKMEESSMPLLPHQHYNHQTEEHLTSGPIPIFLEETGEPPIVVDLVTLHDIPMNSPKMLQQHHRPLESSQAPQNGQEHEMSQQNSREQRAGQDSPNLQQHTLEPSEKQYQNMPYLEHEYQMYESQQDVIPSTSTSTLSTLEKAHNEVSDTQQISQKKPKKKSSSTTKAPKIPISFGFAGDVDGSQSVPGNPGSDYPIYNEIPFTNFNCREYKKAGFYADLEAGCQIFHNCDTGMKKHSFICPNGTIFHQELFICDWWYNVHCDDSPNFYSLNDGLYVGPPKPDEEKDKERNRKN